MKVITTCSIDPKVIQEAKRRKINISHTLEKALIVETALTDGIERSKIQKLVEEREREINLLKMRLVELEVREKQFDLIRNMPEVIESVNWVKEHPEHFEGRLRTLQNNHIQITREQFVELIGGKKVESIET